MTRLRWFALALALLLATPLLLAWLALADAPTVRPLPPPTVDDIARARALWREHDPRQSRPGELRSTVLDEDELNLLLGRLAAPLAGLPLRARLEPGVLVLQGSAELRRLPWRRWLNLEARVDAGAGWPRLASLRAGALVLPGWLAEPLLETAWRREARLPQRPSLERLLHSAVVERRQLALLYEWRPEAARELLAGFTSEAEAARLQVYGRRLAELAAGSPPGSEVPLSRVLPPLFALAQSRSASPEAAAQEHRALLLALAVHATGRNLGSVVPHARAWSRPGPMRLTLAGRDDFAQHFLVSAFLAIEAGTPLADAVGTYKELADARGGSGFSFNDIAADRAGTRFGELAARSPEALQSRLAGGVRESDLLPDVSDLPEFLSERAFARHYGGVGAPAYEAMLADIERRVAATPALRQAR